jgi:hypothetical protein
MPGLWERFNDVPGGNGLSYYLGPAARPISALAGLIPSLAPGADTVDMQRNSAALMDYRGPMETLGDAGWLGLSTLGMALPGRPGALREPVEEAAKGIRAYHGSATAGLNTINPQSTRGALGPGAYFSPAKNVAERYGENVYEADLPGVFDGIGSMSSDVNPFQVWRDQTAKLVEAAPPEKRAEIEAISKGLNRGDGYPLYVRIAQALKDEGAAQDLFRRAGFNGISGVADGPEIVMFDPVSVGGGASLATQMAPPQPDGRS